MIPEHKSKEELLQEVNELRKKLAEFEKCNIEHKQYRELLQESEEKLRGIFDSSTCAITVTDLNGNITECNPEALHLYEFSEKRELIGTSVFDLIAPEDRQRAAENMRKTLKQDFVKDIEHTFLKKNGHRFPAELSASVIRDSSGNPSAFIIITKDITERKLMEKSLRVVNQALVTLSKCNQAVMQATDEYELFHDICRIIVEEGGYRMAWVGIAEQDKGKTVRPVAQAGFEEGYLDTVKITWADTERGRGPTGTAIRTGKPCIVRNILTDPDFTPWCEEATKRGFTSCIALPIIVQGKIIGALNIHAGEPDAYDLDEAKLLMDMASNLAFGIDSLRRSIEKKNAEEKLKESEEKYRLVVENAINAIIVVQDGKLKYVNPRAIKDMGYSNDELTSKPFMEFVHPDDQIMVYENYIKAIRGETPSKINYFRVVDKNRNIKWVEHSSVIITWDDKPALLSFMTDITERKNSEEKLRESEIKFYKAQKMEAVGRLIGGIAHDFNNLLTAIIGYSDYLFMQFKEDESVKSYISEIKMAGDRAASLIHQLLAFSKRQILKPKVININNIISDMENMIRRIIGEDITLITLLDGNLKNVKADQSQLEQVIMNLVVNARDAMPKGGKLTIKTANIELDEKNIQEHPVEVPGTYVMFSVSDTGVGMDRETKEHIFEPFFTTKEKGTGLGLSTVYGIVKQSGGYIWVYSEKGRGAVFKIYLPSVAEITVTQEKETLLPVNLTGKETILLVEDDEIVRKLCNVTLSKYGYKIIETKSGEEAIDKLKKIGEPVDLIITDIVMPEMSGWELVTKLSIRRPKLKVLYMSGYAEDVISPHMILDENTPFLEKPFTPYELLKKVREVLDRE